MSKLLIFLFALINFKSILAQDSNDPTEEIILPFSAPQKIYSRYQTAFNFHHDRGPYLNLTAGPQWNHSLKKPEAKGIRFGGKLALGWYTADQIALYVATWGSFLEGSTLIAGGPGIAFLFDTPNLALDFTVGIGRAFTPFKDERYTQFAETVLAANFSLSKYWWLSNKTNLGLSLSSGIHGLSVSTGKINTIGWSAGLSLAFLFG
jgi:hypothetical protein